MEILKKNRVVQVLVPVITILVVAYILINESKTKAELFYEEFGTVMGTSGRVQILPTDSLKVPVQDAFSISYGKLKQVEALLSRFKETSDISRINAARAGEKVKVDPLTWRILLESRRFYQLTNGAFDPSIGTLMTLYPWREKNLKSLPDAEIIAEALKNCGFDKLVFDREGMYISKKESGLIIDLGGIAKGYGVSIMAESLRSLGVESAALEIGGEVETIGSPGFINKERQVIGDEQSLWSVKIRNPRGQDFIKNLSLKKDTALATSGDYEKFFEVGNKRYSHILDPKTGYPVSGGIISATIETTRSCAVADALATSVSVLGVEKARELLKLFPGTTAYLVLDDMSMITITGGFTEEDNSSEKKEGQQ